MAPKFEDLLKAGGKVEEAPAAAGPRFDEMVKAGGKVEGGGPISQEPGDLAPQAQPKAEGTGFQSKLASVLRGVQTGGSFGFADEANAALGSIPRVGKYLRTPLGELWDKGPREEKDYQGALEEVRGEFDKSHDENRGLSNAAEIATAIAMPGPGKAKGATMLARIGKGALSNAALGALYGLGNSRASLVQGDLAGVGKDAGLSGAIGGAGGALFGALGEGGSKLLQRAGKGVAKAESDAAAMATKKVEDAIASQRGKYRSGVQSASRDLEVLQAAAQDPAHPLYHEAQDYLKSQAADGLREMVTHNKLQTAPERIGEMQGLKAEFDRMVGSKAGDIAKGKEELLANPITKQVLPRAKLLANRFIPPIAGVLVGNAVDDGTGAAVGGGLGTVLSLVQGRPGTVVRNMVHSPGFRKMWWSSLEGLLGGGGFTGAARGALGAYEVPLAAAAAHGSEALLAKDKELEESDPKYSAMKLSAVLGSMPRKKAP